MLATNTISLSSHHSSKPTGKPCAPSGSRPVLADSTNASSRSDGIKVLYAYPQWPKRVVYPTSSARTGLGSGSNDYESSAGYLSTSCHPRHHHPTFTTSPFQVTYKAPPTVSVSLSAACSQNGQEIGSSRVQGLEPDLPDVTSVVPFPSTPLDGSMDIEMLDGTCVPSHDGHLAHAQTPRKRRSAHSTASSSQGNLAKKDSKDVSSRGSTRKRARKSRKQVAEIWWLGVLHRSIVRGIEARQGLDASKSSQSPHHDFDAMDRVLVEKIRKRLVDNGCFEGRALPSPLPRISSPTISVPSLNLVAPIRRIPSFPVPFELASDLDQKSDSFDGSAVSSNGATSSGATQLVRVPCPESPSIISRCPIPIPIPSSTSSRPHVHFEIPQRSREHHTHPSTTPRRSPSPPVRAGSSPTHAQTVTLTMSQIVASLTLAHRERCRSRPRGRSSKGGADCRNGETADRSLPPSQVVRCDAGDAIRDEERMLKSFDPRGRLSRAPERKSPLSHIAYIES